MRPRHAEQSASIVIACHTERRWSALQRAISSARAQVPAPAQVIVAVDHNRALAARLRDETGGIEIVDHDGVPGAGGTRNAAAALATAPLLAFLDDDVRARDGWLRELMAPLRDPEVVGAGGLTLPAWIGARPSWFPDEFGWVVGAWFAGMPVQPAAVRNVWSENMIVRRDAFTAVGGFRPGFGKLGLTSLTEDDTDLCIRISASPRGGRWMYVPSAIVDHEVPPERTTLRYFLRRCYLEGAGKIKMSSLLGADRNLRDERSYIVRTLSRAIPRELRAGHADRALAILAGAGAAAAGAGAALLDVARARRRAGALS
ncbi:MAG: glycosyltransferase family 2 protein [Solirubrobacteraceae bacterium]